MTHGEILLNHITAVVTDITFNMGVKKNLSECGGFGESDHTKLILIFVVGFLHWYAFYYSCWSPVPAAAVWLVIQSFVFCFFKYWMCYLFKMHQILLICSWIPRNTPAKCERLAEWFLSKDLPSDRQRFFWIWHSFTSNRNMYRTAFAHKFLSHGGGFFCFDNHT